MTKTSDLYRWEFYLKIKKKQLIKTTTHKLKFLRIKNAQILVYRVHLLFESLANKSNSFVSSNCTRLCSTLLSRSTSCPLNHLIKRKTFKTHFPLLKSSGVLTVCNTCLPKNPEATLLRLESEP
jgi:hypothetical protein